MDPARSSLRSIRRLSLLPIIIVEVIGTDSLPELGFPNLQAGFPKAKANLASVPFQFGALHARAHSPGIKPIARRGDENNQSHCNPTLAARANHE